MNVKNFPCYVYHICRKEDKWNFEKGYIGISIKPSKRWNSGYAQCSHLKSSLKKYKDVIKYVIFFGTRKQCSKLEEFLRPEENMGWNILKGGKHTPNNRGKQIVTNTNKPSHRKGKKLSEETRKRIRESLLVPERRQQLSDNMRGSKNPAYGLKGENRFMFKGWYITPLGKFDTRRDAANAHGVCEMTISRRCCTGGVIKHNRWTPKEWFGLTWEDVGFGFEPISDLKQETVDKRILI